MLVHSVYFWLRSDLSNADQERFWILVKRLLTISSVKHGWVGKPAETEDRPIIDKSYTCALVLVFDGLAEHDEYQADLIHDEFRTGCSGFWSKIQIYDAVS